ncbi:MAG: Hsp20/alpha crystallin family protein [bacterium]|nr:MAG: Hsp20/alpha crystallin family protein [bacterium]
MKRKRDFTWNTGWTLTRFQRLVYEFSGRFPKAPDWAGETSEPAMDIFEKGDEVVVEMEVPGMAKEELSVTIEEDRLKVQGFKRGGGDSGCLRYLCLEREFGIFRRTVTIPSSVDTTTPRATVVDGILRISFRKVNERRRSIVEVPIVD